ncbi:uncharacterized protein LOC106080154 [Biomphalaria glabrata]|uniref:Uncharacterized protein LOC106080154 n=1 Tax=Biomphalaria glabrata TaxID=6526 RepID=A0A9W3AI22_BIOGL|nr:uncharacterized protein LOC106080154 [Biomphalaria glabrata]KAI8786780.1 mesocentin [Biomphalaria glabrata]
MPKAQPVVLENDELFGTPLAVTAVSSSTYKTWDNPESESESCYDQYLKRSLGNYLSQCLQEVVELKPRDPIEFIAKYLYKCVDNEHYHKEKILFLQSLVQQKQLQEMEGKRRQLVIKQMMAGAEEQKRTIRQLKLAELNDLMITLSLESDPPDKSLLFRAKALASATRDSSVVSELEKIEKLSLFPKSKGRRSRSSMSSISQKAGSVDDEQLRSKKVSRDEDGKELWDGSRQYPDGSVQRTDGVIYLPDGSVKFPDGLTTFPDGTVRFPDGTVRLPDGRVSDLNYEGVEIDEDGTIHYSDGTIRHPDGTVVYPDGSVRYPDENGVVIDPDGTKRYPDGTVELPNGTIIYPDGMVRYGEKDPRNRMMQRLVDTNLKKYDIQDSAKAVALSHGIRPVLPPILAGSSEEQLPNGGVRLPDGSIRNPDGTILLLDGSVQYPGGTRRFSDGKTQFPDGSIVFPDGRVSEPDRLSVEIDEEGIMHYPDGTVRFPDGRVQYPDGKIRYPDRDGVVEDPDGTLRYPDGTLLLPDGTKLFPDGSVLYPDKDPRRKKLEYFVDNNGKRKRLDSIQGISPSKQDLMSAMQGGKFRVNKRGFLEFYDNALGVLAPSAPKPAAFKVDDPKYWMSKDFACESMYDHELYTVCSFEMPTYPSGMRAMSIEDFIGPFVRAASSKKLNVSRSPAQSGSPKKGVSKKKVQ